MATISTGTDERAGRVELILAQLDSLPTLPAVATRLLELTTSPDSSAREVVRLIESDQSLTARILSMTRKADAGIRSTVATVDKAVVLLGFEAVTNAVLAIKVFETFARHEPAAGTGFDRPGFWKHSLAVACGAQLAAEQLGRGPRADVAFVCGLLHDIGKVAIDACLPKSYERVVRRANLARGCIADIEREVLGVDHTVAGHRLAQRWRLPQSLAECIWLHHHGPSVLPASVGHPVEVVIVHFADRLARELRLGYSGNFYPDPPAAALAGQIGLTRAQFDQIVRDLPHRIEERALLIGLDRLSSAELYMTALADANDELSRTNTALAASNRQLSIRSRYFSALNGLNRRIAGASTHGEACAAAAEAVRSALELPAAAVFFCSPGTGLLHVGFADAQADGRAHPPASGAAKLPQTGTAGGEAEASPWSTAWDASLVAMPEDWASASSAGGDVSFLPGSAAMPALTERIRAETGLLLPWFCPIVQDGRCTAGVLLGGEAGSPTRWAGEVSELGSLFAAIRLWLTAIESQHAARRLNEDLADINRRLQQAQREAARARSLAMIAEMAAGAAHELNNPLAVISGRAQMLYKSPPDEATRRVAEVLAEQAQRCSRIVTELMEFAKPGDPKKRIVPLASLLERIRDAWLDSGSLAPDQFALEISDEMPHVHVDPDQIHAAFDELIRNAVEAMEGRPARLVVNCQWDPTDENVVIRVEDHGRGMGPDTLERAMDPFFSQRSAGRGRGLGLSRAVRWIEINGGRLRLDSRENEGTTAFVEFPVTSEGASR